MEQTVTKAHGITFSEPMVTAILAGRKTMTRRVVKPQPELKRDLLPTETGPDGRLSAGLCLTYKEGGTTHYCGTEDFVRHYSPFKVGDHLWVQEVWGIGDSGGRLIDPCINYKAGGKSCQRPLVRFESSWRVMGKFACWDEELLKIPSGWRSPIFMPRWASRITLTVTGVRVERLQTITREDAKSEGIGDTLADMGLTGTEQEQDEWRNRSTAENFAFLWDQLNALRGFSWGWNPWVWVIEFTRMGRIE